jgi:hypothetical protein
LNYNEVLIEMPDERNLEVGPSASPPVTRFSSITDPWVSSHLDGLFAAITATYA